MSFPRSQNELDDVSRVVQFTQPLPPEHAQQDTNVSWHHFGGSSNPHHRVRSDYNVDSQQISEQQYPGHQRRASSTINPVHQRKTVHTAENETMFSHNTSTSLPIDRYPSACKQNLQMDQQMDAAMTSKMIPIDQDTDVVPDHVFLVVGRTGVGKSTLIKAFTGQDVGVGHGIKSYTSGCTPYTFLSQAGDRITLVDTPGFDDSAHSEDEVLALLASYVLPAHGDQPISGIIYLHPITMQRFTGKDILNVRLLKALCGKLFYKHVLVVTTMWDRIIPDLQRECEEREKAIRQAHWDDMCAGGAKICRFHGDDKSLDQILGHIIKSAAGAPPLKIVSQLRKEVPLEETDAGQIATEERNRRVRELEQEREEAKMELENAKKEVETAGKQLEEGSRPESGKPNVDHPGRHNSEMDSSHHHRQNRSIGSFSVLGMKLELSKERHFRK